jgi:hypothetical protein
LRPPALLGPGPLIQLAADSGCAGVVLDGGCRLPEIPLVAQRAFRQRLSLPALVAPMPEMKLAPGKRLPSLAALDDRAERAAAVDMVRQAIEATRDLGTKTVILDFGRVPLAVPEAMIRAHFARRELEEGEIGRTAFEAALAERRKRAGPILDACRAALDPLVREAERHAVRLALLPAATPWQAPSPRETTTLLEDFAGAPIATVFSPARLMILAALGLELSRERREALRRSAAVVEATDAVGLEIPLLPGLGEVDLGELDGAPPDALIVLTAAPDTSDGEVAAVRRMLDERKPAPPATPEAR